MILVEYKNRVSINTLNIITSLIYRVEIKEIIIGVMVKRGNMSSFLVPVTMIVIRHDSNPVKIT